MLGMLACIYVWFVLAWTLSTTTIAVPTGPEKLCSISDGNACPLSRYVENNDVPQRPSHGEPIQPPQRSTNYRGASLPPKNIRIAEGFLSDGTCSLDVESNILHAITDMRHLARVSMTGFRAGSPVWKYFFRRSDDWKALQTLTRVVEVTQNRGGPVDISCEDLERRCERNPGETPAYHSQSRYFGRSTIVFCPAFASLPRLDKPCNGELEQDHNFLLEGPKPEDVRRIGAQTSGAVLLHIFIHTLGGAFVDLAFGDAECHRLILDVPKGRPSDNPDSYSRMTTWMWGTGPDADHFQGPPCFEKYFKPEMAGSLDFSRGF